MFYFNPRSRVGNDILSIKFARTTLTFQSTFPRGERRKTIDNVKAEEKFQSTFPRGERPMLCDDDFMETKFQSTFPRGERHRINAIGGITIEFQSTFPRGERRSTDSSKRLTIKISIHVPAWGTTGSRRRPVPSCLYFNPRSRVGNDPGSAESCGRIRISIHVPAWGTTAKTYKFSIFIYTFLYKLVFFAI